VFLISAFYFSSSFGAQSHAYAETKPLDRSWRTFAQVYI